MDLWFYRKGFRAGVMIIHGYTIEARHNGKKLDLKDGDEAAILQGKYSRFFFTSEDEMLVVKDG